MTILRAHRNPVNCEELSVYLGYPVRSWTKFDDGSWELDIDLPPLTPLQRQVLKRKLVLLPLQIEIEGEGTTFGLV